MSKHRNIHFFNISEYIFVNTCNTDYYIDYGILTSFPIFSNPSLTT